MHFRYRGRSIHNALSFLSGTHRNRESNVHGASPQGANDLEIPLEGFVVAPLTVYGHTITSGFLVKKDSVNLSDLPKRKQEFPIILGCNVLTDLISLAKNSEQTWSQNWQNAFKTLKIGQLSSLESEVMMNKAQKVKIHIGRNNEMLPPNSVTSITCNVSDLINEGSSVLIQNQPFQVPVFNQISVCEGCQKVESGTISVGIINASQESIILPSGIQVGIALPLTFKSEIFSEYLDNFWHVRVLEIAEAHELDGGSPSSFSKDLQSKIEQEISPSEGQEREEFVFSNGERYLLPVGISLKGMTPEQAHSVAEMLRRQDKAFSSGSYDLGFCNLIPHIIQLSDGPPISLPYRRIPPHEVEEVKEQTQKMIDRGIIRRSSSRFGCPIVIVRKKDNSIRLCIDYRKVNARTLLDAFPLPRIEEALEVLANTQLYTSLDLAHGYLQIAMDPESIPITAFRVPWGPF